MVLIPLVGSSAARDGHTLHETRLLCSQLHLAIIQAFLLAGKNEENPQDEMELEPGEVMDESDSRHLIKGTDLKQLTQDMTKLIDKLKNVDFNHSITEQQVQLSLDRFAQTLQVAIATGCLSATKGNSVIFTQHLGNVVVTCYELIYHGFLFAVFVVPYYFHFSVYMYRHCYKNSILVPVLIFIQNYQGTLNVLFVDLSHLF